MSDLDLAITARGGSDAGSVPSSAASSAAKIPVDTSRDDIRAFSSRQAKRLEIREKRKRGAQSRQGWRAGDTPRGSRPERYRDARFNALEF